VFAVVWFAPHRVIDPDALSRLALGRWLWLHGSFPVRDPFTFSAPAAAFGDPEWLGDGLFFATYGLFGQAGLQTAAIALASLGYSLAFSLGRRLGAAAGVMLLLLMCSLPVAAPRINARNDVHLFWLFPLLGHLLLTARSRPAAWYALAICAWVWANLHSSYVIACALLAIAVALQPGPRPVVSWVVALSCPLFPWLGLAGSSTYRQIIDHASGAPIYRALISEWQSPLTSPGVLAIAPLYLLSALGLWALMRSSRRRDWLSIVYFSLGCLLAYTSRRFLPALVYLIAPAIASALSELSTHLTQSWRRTVGLTSATVLAGYLALANHGLRDRSGPSVLQSEQGASHAVHFLVDNAPYKARVFNAFDDGPWLLWLGDGTFRHYLDPRNEAGAPALASYRQLLTNTRRFDVEAARTKIDLALVPLREAGVHVLAQHLAGAPDWTLVYWDGARAVYARREAANAALLARYGYRILRPTLDLRYLRAPGVDDAVLRRELAELETQAPLETQVIRAYRTLTSGGRDRAAAAARVIRAAWPSLIDTQSLRDALSDVDLDRVM
jgi:hypothetical protein